MKRIVIGVAAGTLLLGACGSDGDEQETEGAAATTPVGAADDPAPPASDDLQGSVDDLAEDLEDLQDAAGGGGATFTANGQTWQFPSVLCAFGADQIGQPGAVFNLSAISDGLQLYASIDDDGESHSLSLNDIEDFANPSVALSVDGFVAGLVGAPTEFLVLDGKQVQADVAMMDETTNQPIGGTAQLSASCP